MLDHQYTLPHFSKSKSSTFFCKLNPLKTSYKFFHKTFSIQDDLSSKLVEDQTDISVIKAIFLLIFSLLFIFIYIYTHTHTHIYIYIYHVVQLAQISLTLSRHFSLSFIGRSSGLHPVFSHSCCMYVLPSRPAFARPYLEVHRSTSLMNLSLLLYQCPACRIRLIWIVFVMGGR